MNTSRQGRLWFGLLAALLLLGLASRGRYYLAARSFWYDEAFVLLNIYDRSYSELLGRLEFEQAAPPLYLCSLRLIHDIWDGEELAMRLPAFLAGVAAIGVMIPTARRICGRWGLLWPIAAFLFSATAIFNSTLVKPYSFDLLATLLVLWPTVTILTSPESRRAKWLLLLVAVMVPWFSYPSVFTLGAAGLALMIHAVQLRSRALAVAALLPPTLAGLSLGAIMSLAGRDQYSAGLQTYWKPFFADLSSFSAATNWLLRTIWHSHHYASREAAAALLILGMVGGISLAQRRRFSMLVLLVGPWLFALAANVAEKYPLEDRLLLFGAPLLWLLAGVGVAATLDFLRSRMVAWSNPIRYGGIALMIGPLGFGCAHTVMCLIDPPAKADYRSSLLFVEARMEDGDLRRVYHTECERVYERLGRISPSLSDPDRCIIQKHRRVWVIGPPEREAGLVADLRARRYTPTERKTFTTVCATLWTAPPD